MAYLALAYPKLSEGDYAWIQAYRKRNDPKYFNVVSPHFTLVFDISDISQDDFVQEIEARIKDSKSFKVELRVATINRDDSGEYFHEFLVPDEGYSNIVKLHDRLYSGCLSKYLRLDLDFIPHIGIGNSESAAESKDRIDELNKSGVHISGTIDSVDIVEYKDGTVTTIKKIRL